MKTTRLYFTTDLHGSQTCFNKLCHAPDIYEVKTVLIGGDLTGKTIILGKKRADGVVLCDYLGQVYELKNENELSILRKNIELSGSYLYCAGEEEYQELQADEAKISALFQQLRLERVSKWMRALSQMCERDADLRVIVTGGNDDDMSVEKVLRETEGVTYSEEEIVEIDQHELVSCGYSNRTPWNCPRDVSEEELHQKIEDSCSHLRNAADAIFNFHCPPNDSQIDTCQKLDATFVPPKPIHESGQPVMFGAGSTAVRQAIEKYQPLLGLHGHIHEAAGSVRIGRTLCINPGSEYQNGTLRGVLVFLRGSKMDYQTTSG
jgi:Icc-related predicted phosphoesterase